MELYRVVGGSVMLRQVPQRWVLQQSAYRLLAAARGLEERAAIALDAWRRVLQDAAGQNALAKVWTELIFEDVRQRIAPDRPSRLESVFCCADMLEAFAFAGVGAGDRVFRAVVEPGATWCLVDWRSFVSARPGAPTVDAMLASWSDAAADAERYWRPKDEIARAEILVAGAVDLLEPELDRIDLFQHLGLCI